MLYQLNTNVYYIPIMLKLYKNSFVFILELCLHFLDDA